MTQYKNWKHWKQTYNRKRNIFNKIIKIKKAKERDRKRKENIKRKKGNINSKSYRYSKINANLK